MRYILGTLILMISTVGAAFAECSEADKKELEAFDRAWGNAGAKGDKAALLNIYADDFMGLPGMETKTAAIESTMAAFERNKANPDEADQITHDAYAIACSANTATITHRNVISTKNGAGGNPETFWTRSVHFLEKRGEKWQVICNAGHGMDDYMIIGYLEQDWNDAILKRNKAWFEKNYASDFTGVNTTTGKLENKAQDIAGTINSRETMELVETTDVNIRIDGDRAIATGIFRTKGKDENGKPFDRKLRYTDTWIKRDGRWQAWATAGAFIP